MTALLGAVETLQHDIPLGLGNAGPGVAHLEAEPILSAKNAQDHSAGRRRELDRVVDQVADRLE